ncbi:MAG: hypothetical protein IKX35_08945 [Bacteroidales bacterium]|nr:hypothetical protein [Bacteroidales bacterium]
MKLHFSIGLFFIVLTLMTTCHPKNKVMEPSEGLCQKLKGIDSLMWHQPDSALMQLLPWFDICRDVACNVYPENNNGNLEDVARYVSTNAEYNHHYADLLLAELLYKNHFDQNNRANLLRAVDYFDSLCLCTDDALNVSTAFLDARAHYVNGVGYYEQDSLVQACTEYIRALEIMETHFPSVETRRATSLQPDHVPRFMSLTYSRIAELFSDQFMQEPAIVCFKKSLAYDDIEPGTLNNHSTLLLFLGKQYLKLNQYDSAEYHFDEALRLLSDTNNMVFRDLIAVKALLSYNKRNDFETSIRDLKRITAQAENEKERLNRYLTMGGVYQAANQYDSAVAYLMPVFEHMEDVKRQKIAANCLREIYQEWGDTLKAAQFAMYQADNTRSGGEANALVSKLNDLFQQHLQWEQEKAFEENQQTEQRRRARGIMITLVVLLVFGLGLWGWLAKRKRERDAETLTLHEEKQQLQTQVDEAQQQARAMLSQRATDLYYSNAPNRMERIMAEFEAAYPQALERLAAAYPELTEAERQIAVLNFLHFRAKEEAELTSFAENTILKYRSNLNKKAGSDPISALIEE